MALTSARCPVTGEAVCFCGLDEDDPARQPVTTIFEADDQEGVLQGRTFEYSVEGLTSTAENDGFLLSDGNTDKVHFVGGDDVIKDFTIGEDALTIDVPGLQLAVDDVSTNADFVAMIEAATLVEANGQAAGSTLEAYVCEHPEDAADLVLVVRSAEGQAEHSVKLIGLASEIGIEALEAAGAIVEPHDAETSEHDHSDGPVAAMDMAAMADHDGHDEMIPDVIEDDNAFLMAMGEGSRIEIHAADASKESWTQLSQSAFAGDSVLHFTEDTGWEIGDKIAIAPSGQDYTEDEEREILRISDDGKTVTLDKPLEFDHYGKVETYTDGNNSWQVDMRAEVALLSRNVTIQGDADSVDDGYGAHTMVMHGAEQHISGAEFYRVGQEGLLGKYPIHWHMSGDASGQYVTNVSVHDSYQKGATIHGTSNVLFDDNVIYDHIGHGVFMEDGSETGNVIKGNLVFGTHASKTGEPIPTDRTDVSSYWIENVSNTFIGNHAAGSENVGFFIAPATETGPHGLSEGMDVPNDADDFYFVGNTASSSEFGVFLDGHIDDQTLEHVDGQNFSLDGSLWFVDTTAYANRDVGLWSFKGNASDNYVVVTDAKLADNASNLEVRGDDFLFIDSVSIGETDNIAAEKNTANIGVKTYRN
ncbi:MAG: right-handed parallel beta-helix repeat-containing protein, partial [Pseudomonadota bacterium]